MTTATLRRVVLSTSVNVTPYRCDHCNENCGKCFRTSYQTGVGSHAPAPTRVCPHSGYNYHLISGGSVLVHRSAGMRVDFSDARRPDRFSHDGAATLYDRSLARVSATDGRGETPTTLSRARGVSFRWGQRSNHRQTGNISHNCTKRQHRPQGEHRTLGEASYSYFT